MAVNKETYLELKAACDAKAVTLVAVSKLKPLSDILELYNLGHRDFGENYVQELVEKAPQLPPDIRWHFIGHLQRNKVKYIAPFVHLIHGIDTANLLAEVAKQAVKNKRTIPVLIQIHIAEEETKFGFSESELKTLYEELKTAPLPNVEVKGLMGMASNSDGEEKLNQEFLHLKKIFDAYRKCEIKNSSFQYLSMGMSGDYKTAIAAGSNMIRIGSLLFGARTKTA